MGPGVQSDPGKVYPLLFKFIVELDNLPGAIREKSKL